MSATWQNTGVNQQPSGGEDYPFLSPSNDIKYALSDLWLAYYDDAREFKFPFRVAWLYGFGAAAYSESESESLPTAIHARDMLIVDADGVVVFDSTQASGFTIKPWGARLYTMEWRSAAGVLRVTAHGSPDEPSTPLWAPQHELSEIITPEDGRLDPRTYSRLLRGVVGLSANGLSLSARHVRLVEGYNMRLRVSTETRGLRRVNYIAMRGLPNDGAGLAPADIDAVELKTVSKQVPDAAGNLTMDAADCYWLSRSVSVSGESPRVATLVQPTGHTFPTAPIDNADKQAATLRLNCSCDACCTCGDYVKSYKKLSGLWDRYKWLSHKADELKRRYEALCACWANISACLRVQPLRLTVSSEPFRRFFVAGAFCNPYGARLTPVLLRVTLTGYQAGFPVSGPNAHVMCYESYRAGSDTSGADIAFSPAARSAKVYDINFDYANARAISQFRTRFRTTAGTGTVKITLSLHVPDSADAQGRQVDLPDPGSIVVADDVLALWATYPPAYPVRAIFTKQVVIRA